MLTAAAHLARGGTRVIVCEQHDQAGGCFNPFRRGGYLFDAGIKAIENALITETDVRPIRSPENITAFSPPR